MYTRIGAVYSIVFGGVSAKELAIRIDDCKLKFIIAASCGIELNRIVPYQEMVNEAIELAEYKVPNCLVHERPNIQEHREGPFILKLERDFDYAVVLHKYLGRKGPCEHMDAIDPFYSLYPAATAGRPKGVVRDTGGSCVVNGCNFQR